MTKQERPKCQICGQQMAEGSIYRRGEPYEPLYVCHDCYMLVGALVTDGLPHFLRQLVGDAEKSLTEKLEGWQYREGGEK